MRRSDTEVAGERDMLAASLDDARHAVVATLTDVPVALLREPLLWPHGSLLAIVKHLTPLERWWFAHTFAGLDMDSPMVRRHVAGGVAPRALRHGMGRHGALSPRVPAQPAHRGRAALDQVAARAATSGPSVALRWIMLHMIEETNRHAGHADVLRQLIDGTNGSPPCAGRHHRDGDVRRLPDSQAKDQR